MIKKKRVGYFEYNPVIYPRKLRVAIGMMPEDANKCFMGADRGVLDYDFFIGDGLVFEEVVRRSDGKYCELVIFENKSAMRIGTLGHETSHVCDGIEKAIGMEHGGEASAYLMGWIISCIDKARLGIGNFVEVKDIKVKKKK